MNNDYMFEDEDNLKKGSYDGSQYEYQYYDMNSNQAPKSIALAVFSFAIGVVSLIFFITGLNIVGAIISIVLAIIFLASYKQRRGKAFAITGIVTSVLSICFFFFSWVFILSNAENIAELANDTEGLQFLYDYYGISEDDVYRDILEEYEMYDTPADDNIFENNELNMDDTL